MTEKPSLTIYVCRFILHETEQILSEGAFPGVRAKPFPIACTHPQKGETLQTLLDHFHSKDEDGILLAGGCLQVSELERNREGSRLRVYRATQCFEFFSDRRMIDTWLAEGAYLLTPGWLTRWRQSLSDWGFDQETARVFFSESVSNLVLLDTEVDPSSAGELKAMGDYLSLPFQSVAVGLDHYRLLLTSLILEWQVAMLKKESAEKTSYIDRKEADQAMFLDLMASLTRMGTEVEAADQIMPLFDMLFAPTRVVYASVVGGKVVAVRANPQPVPSVTDCQNLLLNGTDAEAGTEGSQTFHLKLTFRGETLGLLIVEDVAFPSRYSEYRELAEPISQVCGLAISNSRMYQDLKELAITDSLTGLFNRRYFFGIGTSEYFRARRYHHELTALMLDIDLFKNTNDTYGHAAGDKVLIEVARCIKDELRASDICGRYGGEEFILLLPETGLEIGQQVAERIRGKIEGLCVEADGRGLSVTASLGLAILDESCSSLEDLIRKSDRAMYEAKQAGRNQVCTAKP